VEVEAAFLGAHRVGRTGDVLWWRYDRSSMLVRPLQRMLAAFGQLPVERLVDGVATRNWRYRRREDVPDSHALTAYEAASPANGGRVTICPQPPSSLSSNRLGS